METNKNTIETEAKNCPFCRKPLQGHKRCKNCTRPIHDMSKIKNQDSYYCTCGINHNEQSKDKPNLCTDCS